MLKLEQVKLEPGQPEELLAGKAAHMLRIPTEDILDLSAVSYTHLDVYKRQSQCRAHHLAAVRADIPHPDDGVLCDH